VDVAAGASYSGADLSDALTLTQHIPRLLSWPAHGLEAELVDVTLPRLLERHVALSTASSSVQKLGEAAELGPLISPFHLASIFFLNFTPPLFSIPLETALIPSTSLSGAVLLDTGDSRSSVRLQGGRALGVALLTGTSEAPRLTGRITCFEKGFVLSDCRFGCFVISFAQVCVCACVRVCVCACVRVCVSACA
jgi:hypothetical protein